MSPPWEAARAGDVTARNQIVLDHMYIVDQEAQRAASDARYLERDNLAADGIVGLYDAVRRFDPARGVPFEAFARPRVRGEIQEGLRRAGTWGGPTHLRQRRHEYRAVRRADEDLTARLGRAPTPGEIAHELGWTVQAVESAQAFGFDVMVVRIGWGVADGKLFELDDNDSEDLIGLGYRSTAIPERAVDVEGSTTVAELAELVVEAMERLPERERVVYGLYYYEHLTFTDISKVLEVSVSRVSQVHTEAVTHLRDLLDQARRARHHRQ